MKPSFAMLHFLVSQFVDLNQPIQPTIRPYLGLQSTCVLRLTSLVWPIAIPFSHLSVSCFQLRATRARALAPHAFMQYLHTPFMSWSNLPATVPWLLSPVAPTRSSNSVLPLSAGLDLVPPPWNCLNCCYSASSRQHE